MQRHAPDAGIPDSAKGAAIALGKFDGVHLGHQAVIATAAGMAQKLGAPLGAGVFEPHPHAVLSPEGAPARLQNSGQRARSLAALGVEHVYEIRFDRALADMTDRDFAERVLKGRFGVRHVSVGGNFLFGRGRMGDAAALALLGGELGFSVEAVAPIGGTHGRVSSTAIRAAIARGDMGEAATSLGRPWAIEGIVQRGFARGRDFGFPTANLALGEYVRPRLGIYAVRVDLGGRGWRPGVASVGVNPTVGALPVPLLEAHLFDFDGDLYGRTIEVALIAFLRDELKFTDVEQLKAHMRRDAEQARALL